MTDRDDEQARQEALLHELAKTKQLAPQLVQKGRNLTEAGQIANELANATEDLARNAPDGYFQAPFYDHVISGLREFNSIAGAQTHAITQDAVLLGLTQGTTTSMVVSLHLASERVFEADPAELRRAATGLRALVQRTTNVDAAMQSMMSFGLDIPRGASHSPVELLRSAVEELKRPAADDGNASGVLIPLREAIQRSIDELLKRRPTIEPARSVADKIASLGAQCGKPGISQDHANRVAETTHLLINKLSGAKDQRMSRGRVTMS